MTEFLRSHPRSVLLVCGALLLFGAWALFMQDSSDLSDAAMTRTYTGFIAFCVGLVGIMILVFRPLPFSKDDAAKWEVTRMDGRGRFITRFLMFTLPSLAAILVAIWIDDGLDFNAALITLILFVGFAVFAGFRLWNYFNYQYSRQAAPEVEDHTRPDEDSTL